MTSPYYSIINYEEDHWQEFLDGIFLIDVFMPVIKEYTDVSTLKCVIRYIVTAYSLESDKIILGMDWQKNKQEIFEYAMLKPEAKSYEDLVLLKNKAVVDAIHNWLNFQDSESFRQLEVLKDLRIEMQISCLSDIKKSSGEVDYDQKYRNAGYANDLKKMIKDLEAELVQNDVKLKDQVKELKTAKRKLHTVGAETFAK